MICKIGNGEIKASVVGEMYIIPADSYQINVTQTTEYSQLTGFNKGRESNVTVDEVSGKFTAEIAGTYKFDGVASVFPSAGLILEFAVFVERPPATAVIVPQINTRLDFQNNQDTNTFSGSGIVFLNKGDIISVRGKASNAPTTIGITNLNVNIIRIGN